MATIKYSIFEKNAASNQVQLILMRTVSINYDIMFLSLLLYPTGAIILGVLPRQLW